MGLDAVSGCDGLACAHDGDGAADPDARELTVVNEAAGVGQPRIGEQVETFVQAALGMGIEVRGALSRVGASAASVTIAPALPSLGGTACGTGVVHVADDGGEVAIADPDLAATRVGTKPALGLVEIFERVAAKRADEHLARTPHRVLGVDGLEERCEPAAQLGFDAAHPLGSRPLVGDELGDRSREPRGIVVGNDAGADERKRKTGLGPRFLRCRRRHGA